jgi:hypothetical protein
MLWKMNFLKTANSLLILVTLINCGQQKFQMIISILQNLYLN